VTRETFGVQTCRKVYVYMVLMVAVALLAAENDLESCRWEFCGEEMIACV
jgi:hypothetical protein